MPTEQKRLTPHVPYPVRRRTEQGVQPNRRIVERNRWSRRRTVLRFFREWPFAFHQAQILLAKRCLTLRQDLCGSCSTHPETLCDLFMRTISDTQKERVLLATRKLFQQREELAPFEPIVVALKELSDFIINERSHG